MKEGDKDEKGRSWRDKQVLRKDLKWQCHEARKYLKEEGRDRRRLKTQKVRGPYMYSDLHIERFTRKINNKIRVESRKSKSRQALKREGQFGLQVKPEEMRYHDN